VQLHKDYADKGVVCISVSVDKPKDNDRAHTFLKDKGAEFPNYRIEADDSKVIEEKWDTDELPKIRVYDRDGKLKGVYSDYKEVLPVVKELIEKSKSD
jgi:hypothetical protein